MRVPCAVLPSLLLLACCTTPPPAPVADPAPAEVVADPAPGAEREPLPEGDYVGLMIAAIDAYEREDYSLAEDTAIAALRLRPDDELASDVLDWSRRARHGGGEFAYRCLVDQRREFAERRAALGPRAAAREEPAPEGDYDELMRAAVDAFCREEFDLAEAHATTALRLRPDDTLASGLLLDSRKSRHCGGGLYFEEMMQRYRAIRDALGPPAPP